MSTQEQCWPLGAFVTGGGVRFSLFSSSAASAEVVLLKGGWERHVPMQCEGDIWSVFVSDVRPGCEYAFRVRQGASSGALPFDGLLLDPYAREIIGSYTAEEQPASVHGLRCRVPEAKPFDWKKDRRPAIAPADMVLYEVHVRGATKLMPGIDGKTAGTYAALASKSFVSHLKKLGVTSVSLMPVFRFADEKRLSERGLTNYWGYNPVSFFTPETRYARNPDHVRDEFRAMVRGLHAAGLEVILDVVYNHTAESDETGPVLSFKGLDNAAYYRLGRHGYENDTGCGNALNTDHRQVLALIADSLAYWYGDMHVDGFRFDLARTLTRGKAFLATLASDPRLAGAKLIAEPWDLGPDGYALGSFPAPWSEWNDRFRDDIRDFWITRAADKGKLASALCGTSSVFRRSGRPACCPVNFITAHDGFTLRDLVSYRTKHNDANGEGGRDGTGQNRSTDCGAEGPTNDAGILARRRALVRALLATLFFSQGTPMLLSGDEMGRTQSGNNNAYCQDSPLTWLAWAGADKDLAAFTGRLAQIRRDFPQLRSPAWRTGENRFGRRDVDWMDAGGQRLASAADWDREPGVLVARLAGTTDILLAFNREAAPASITLPEGLWNIELSTQDQSGQARGALCVPACSVTLLALASPYPRQSGVLLHVTSLPGPSASGDFGDARDFVDWLAEAHQSLWQVLPLTVTGEGNSPYMGASVFAGNEQLIDLRDLRRRGYLKRRDIAGPAQEQPDRIDFEKTGAWRLEKLRLAAQHFFAGDPANADYAGFVRSHAWLQDYALFRAIETRESALGHPLWQDWPQELRQRDPDALAHMAIELAEDVAFWKFAQWMFDVQWKAVRAYARSKGVSIIGDMPIFVSGQSADVWAHQELFELDASGNPDGLAGVPPDYFSPKGQLWGNPLYRWPAHAAEGYAWWTQRLARAAELYDTVRIDHFRGFAAFWRVPSQTRDPMQGAWVKGPGAAPFEAFAQIGTPIGLIAEDLGIITQDVTQLRNQLALPGMRVLQFAFDGNPDNPHQPEAVLPNAAYYTGTHDNDTARGWLESLEPSVRAKVLEALSAYVREPLAAMKLAVLSSRARYAILPVQDVLDLDSSARMNQPGDAKTAWRWRLPEGLLTAQAARQLAALAAKAHRN